jgi:hypothetical protein
MAFWEQVSESEWTKWAGKRRKTFHDGVGFVKTVNGDWNTFSYFRQTPTWFHYTEGKLKTKQDALKQIKRYITSQ